MSSSQTHADDDDQQQQPTIPQGSAGVPRGGVGSASGACARAAALSAHPDDMTFLVDALPFVSVGVDQHTRTLAIVLSDAPAASLSPLAPPTTPDQGDKEVRYPAILLNERAAIHFILSAQEALQHLSRLPLLTPRTK